MALVNFLAPNSRSGVRTSRSPDRSLRRVFCNSSLECTAGKIYEKAAQEIKMECGGSSITLKPGTIEITIGGSKITMNPGQITLKAPMIMEN